MLLHDGPEHRGEGELSRQHSYDRGLVVVVVVRWAAVALRRHDGEKWRRVQSEGAT